MSKTRLGFAGVLLAAFLLPGVRGQDTGKPDAVVAKIDRRVQTWQPTAEERRLDDIAWSRDLRDALRLARESKRPVFLFTYSGSAEREHAMALQRC